MIMGHPPKFSRLELGRVYNQPGQSGEQLVVLITPNIALVGSLLSVGKQY